MSLSEHTRKSGPFKSHLGLIKALRASKNDEERVIRSALDEISVEIKQSDWEVKAGAVLKLIYLEMLGHPHLLQYAFPVIECMSSNRFHLKQIGYLAASQSFREGTEVILLTNNLIKKDMTTPAPTPTVLMLTLSSLPNLLLSSPQLITDLHPELVRQLTSSRPVVRRAAILVLGKLWSTGVNAPIAPEQIVDKLRERLSDDDPAVVTAAVNVVLELAGNASPEEATDLLALAPELFDLLTAGTNNWMLIKIIKTFTLLTPIEPRLVRKLLPPLRQLISTTPAMSLLYECINAVIVGGMLETEGGDALAATCVDKLAAFLEDVDQNLRYMALLALVRLLPTHPGLVARHYDEILHCVDDEDTTIRTQALHLVDGMVDKTNLQDIVSQLMRHLRSQNLQSRAAGSAIEALTLASRGEPAAELSGASLSSAAYRRSLVELIITISTRSTYANVSNFPWLIDTICSLAHISLGVLGLPENLLSDPVIDVAARARAIRPYVTGKMAELFKDEAFRANAVDTGGAAAGILHAAAWIIGEYASELSDAQSLLEPLFDPDMLSALPPVLTATILHNGVKLLSYVASSQGAALNVSLVRERILPCLGTCAGNNRGDVELGERAAQLEAIVQIFITAFEGYKPSPPQSMDTSEWAATDEAPREAKPADLLLVLFTGAYELKPVSAKAQALIVAPEELDLESWIVPAAANNGSEWEAAMRSRSEVDVDEYGRPRALQQAANGAEVEQEEKPRRRKGKEKKRKKGDQAAEYADADPMGKPKQRDGNRYQDEYDADLMDDVDSIPVVQLDLDLQRTPATAKRATPSNEPKPRAPTPPPIFVDVEGELPPETLQRVKADTPPIEETFLQDPPEEGASEAPVVKVVRVKKKEKDVTKKRKKKEPLADM